MGQLLLPYGGSFFDQREPKPRRRPRRQLALNLVQQLALPLARDVLPAPPVASVAQPPAVVECIQQGTRLRVRPVGPGLDTSLYCRFPQRLRAAGARYAVERLELRQPRGAHPYYCAAGQIRRLEA